MSLYNKVLDELIWKQYQEHYTIHNILPKTLYINIISSSSRHSRLCLYSRNISLGSTASLHLLIYLRARVLYLYKDVKHCIQYLKTPDMPKKNINTEPIVVWRSETAPEVEAIVMSLILSCGRSNSLFCSDKFVSSFIKHAISRIIRIFLTVLKYYSTLRKAR